MAAAACCGGSGRKASGSGRVLQAEDALHGREQARRRSRCASSHPPAPAAAARSCAGRPGPARARPGRGSPPWSDWRAFGSYWFASWPEAMMIMPGSNAVTIGATISSKVVRYAWSPLPSGSSTLTLKPSPAPVPVSVGAPVSGWPRPSCRAPCARRPSARRRARRTASACRCRGARPSPGSRPARCRGGGVLGRQGGVVEEAVAVGRAARRMVAGRAHQRVGQRRCRRRARRRWRRSQCLPPPSARARSRGRERRARPPAAVLAARAHLLDVVGGSCSQASSSTVACRPSRHRR